MVESSGSNADDRQLYSMLACVNFIRGVVQATDAIATNFKSVLGICLPNNITNAQLAAIYLNYANQYPETWSEHAAEHLLLALLQHYRC